MFYETAKGHGLPHDPFKAIVAPRPIGWISTIDAQGRSNLAPYSFFNAVGERPPMLAFSSTGAKHSATFASGTGEFVWSMATWALRDQMNASAASLPRGQNEFVHAGLETAPSRLVKPPRVAASPAAFECRVTELVKLKGLDGQDSGRRLVLGCVVGIHLDERFVREGRVDTAAMRPIARGGYDEYSVVERVFTMPRPA